MMHIRSDVFNVQSKQLQPFITAATKYGFNVNYILRVECQLNNSNCLWFYH